MNFLKVINLKVIKDRRTLQFAAFLILIILFPLFLFSPTLSAEESGDGLLEMLEEEPDSDELLIKDNDSLDQQDVLPDPEKKWDVLYLKAFFRHFYKLRIRYTHDQYAVPFNYKLTSEEREVMISNSYISESRINVTDKLSSYIRFEYFFDQYYDQIDSVYRNEPSIRIYEAYISYLKDNVRIRAGGLLMPLGNVDFDSPIDILNQSDLDKIYHLDQEDDRFLTPALEYGISYEKYSWKFYWGPFQRASKEKQSLRSNVGVRLNLIGERSDFGIMFFKWFDPENKLGIEQDLITDPSGDTLIITQEDTPIQFAAFDLDYSFSTYVLKADVGLFKQKNFYNIIVTKSPTGEEQMALETLSLPHAAFAVSLERKVGNWFFMPTMTSWKIFDVPEDTQIYQFENLEIPSKEQRNLERHQLGLYIFYKTNWGFDGNFLVFDSKPFRRAGAALELNWKPEQETSRWRLLLSHVETDLIVMTNKKTQLQRVELYYELPF